MGNLKQYGPALAYLIIALLASYAVYAIQQNTLGTIYQNTLEACERGNALREVVYTNTRGAIQVDPSQPEFRKNLVLLRSTPGVNLKNGTVNCREIVQEP